MEKLSPYAGHIDAEVAGLQHLQKQASDYFGKLQADAQETARQHGVSLTTELLEGDEVQAIVECVRRSDSDLLHSLL